MMYLAAGHVALAISTRKKRKALHDRLAASRVLFLSKARAILLRALLLNGILAVFAAWLPLKVYGLIDTLKELWPLMSFQWKVEIVACLLSYVVSMAAVLLSFPQMRSLKILAVIDREILAGERVFPLAQIQAAEIRRKPLVMNSAMLLYRIFTCMV